MGDWYANGAPVSGLTIDDRGLQYGDGLFETIAIRKGEPRLWILHKRRLARGCKALAINMPTEEDLNDGIAHAIAASKLPDAYCTIKIIVTAGVSRRGYARRESLAPTVLFGAFSSTPPRATFYRDGIDTTVCSTRLAMHSPTAGLKTLNRLEQVLARSELSENKLFEGLTMDADDHLICGTMSNVFFISNKAISTPPIDSCGVAGVMREHVIASLASQGQHVSLEKMPLAELEKVDEVFVSNSQFGVIPVASCDATHWGVGTVTRDVMATMAKAGIIECQS